MKKTFVKEPFKAGGKLYKFGEAVSFGEEETEYFLSLGLLSSEPIGEETKNEEKDEEVLTKEDIIKMTGRQLKKMVVDTKLDGIDLTLTVPLIKKAVVAALFKEEEEDEEIL